MDPVRIKGLAVLLLLSAVAVAPVSAQVSTPSDDEVNAVAKQLYCPVCENVPLDVCPTKACEQWREVIRTKLSEGWDEEQIKQYFVAQYGDRVTATPPPTGINWLVYVIPPLVFLVGAYLLFRALWGWRKTPSAAQPRIEPSEDDPYVSRLEEELRQRD